jgi:hypothetical protein
MNDTPQTPEPQDEAPARNYFLLVLAALAVILMLLLRRGLGVWSLLPVVAGLLSVALPWRAAPFATLPCLAWVLFRFEPGYGLLRGRPSPGGFFAPDWILCVATLAYCVGIFRLHSLASAFFPIESRKRPRDSKGVIPLENRRDPQLVPAAEIGWLLLSLPAWAFLAQVGRYWLLWRSEEPIEIDPKIWHGIALAWLAALAIWLVGGLLDYSSRRRMDRLEATLFLQDSIWYETRREQRRLQHWLAWQRRRSSGKARQ